jgi:hypothetical protein
VMPDFHALPVLRSQRPPSHGCPIPLSISRQTPTPAVSPRAGESFSGSRVPPSTSFFGLRPPHPLFDRLCHPSTCAVLVLRFLV